MIKAKFGAFVRSKTPVAQRNEVLCKVLAHNLCVLVQAFFELGIEPRFWQSGTAALSQPYIPTWTQNLPAARAVDRAAQEGAQAGRSAGRRATRPALYGQPGDF